MQVGSQPTVGWWMVCVICNMVSGLYCESGNISFVSNFCLPSIGEGGKERKYRARLFMLTFIVVQQRIWPSVFLIKTNTNLM